MNIKTVLFVVLIWTITACTSPQNQTPSSASDIEEFVLSGTWKLVSDCGIEFYVPSKLEVQRVQTTDSCAFDLTSENINLAIDVYGAGAIPRIEFHRSKEYSGEKDVSVEKTVIDGQSAEITFYSDSGNHLGANGLAYGAVLEIPFMHLTIWLYSKTLNDRANAVKILKSIRMIEYNTPQ